MPNEFNEYSFLDILIKERAAGNKKTCFELRSVYFNIELMQNWEPAKNDETMKKIAPLFI